MPRSQSRLSDATHSSLLYTKTQLPSTSMAVKTASKMTYTVSVSGGALNSTQSNPIQYNIKGTHQIATLCSSLLKQNMALAGGDHVIGQAHTGDSKSLTTLADFSDCCTLLISLDLSAVFDTIDHSILLNRLNPSFGLTGTVYSWLESYLTDRSVHIGQYSSMPTLCTSGVPRGSVLGPLLFTIFTSPVSNIASLHNVHLHQYLYPTHFFSGNFQPR